MGRRAVWCFLLLSGCGGFDSPELDVEIRSQEIVGGTATTGDPAVVALYTKKPEDEKGALCTGTVIAPRVILTAAHCVHPDLVGTGTTTTVLMGADLNTPETRCPCIPAKETHYDPLFSRYQLMNGHDIAVVIMDQPLEVKPIPFMQKPIPEAAKGQPARIVGYGLDNGFQQTGAGIKRTATLNLNGFDDLFVKTGVWGKGICSGDSGGPVMIQVDGQETVVGVNSFGLIFCIAESSSTRVDHYADFIRPYL